MTAADWRVGALIAAADWLGADPAAAHRARIMAHQAADTGQVAELVEALLDCLAVAVGHGDGNIHGARRRLEDRALAAAEANLDSVAYGHHHPSRNSR